MFGTVNCYTSVMTQEVQSHTIDVLALGHALVDVIAGASEEFLVGEQLDKGSMRLIDSDRAQTLYDKMGPGSEASGGSGANTATGVVACGGAAAFIGTVAEDQLGEIFAHDMRAAGVLYRTPPAKNVPPTGRCMILVTPDGERTMSTYLGAAASVGPGYEDAELLAASAIVYLEGYMLDTEYTVEDLHQLAKNVHASGGKIAFTLSDTFCVERHRADILSLVDGAIDICFGNEDEAKALYETDDLEEALARLAKVSEVVAITKGAAGSVLIKGDERADIEPTRVNVVDTTGAGDLYASGVLAGLAQGWSLERAGRMGSKAAGAIISQMGARLSRDISPVD